MEPERYAGMRIVAAEGLRAALAGVDGAGDALLFAAGEIVEQSVRALVIGSVPAVADRAVVRQLAGHLGIALLEGSGDGPAVPLVLVARPSELARLPDLLDGRGLRALGAELRQTLDGDRRRAFVLPFADGGSMALGGRSRVMGVLNVTPDSFSDGGRFSGVRDAADAALRMRDEGADFVDVGGESTRPGAGPVGPDEESRRVVPVVETVKRRDPSLRVSVDTSKADVARRAVEAGADLVNDVSSLADPAMAPFLSTSGVPVVLMHMRGTPRTMQGDTHYHDLVGEVIASTRGVLARAAAAGIADDRILVDPGVGFGKSSAGNLELLRLLPALRGLGHPVLVGASRKSFIGAVLDRPVEERLEGSLAAAAVALWQGAHVVRVHDVAATCRVARMVDAIRGG